MELLILDDKPYKLEVFEDMLYITTYHTHNIFRMDKFGRKNGTYLVQGLPRVSTILIVQENKQDKSSNVIFLVLSYLHFNTKFITYFY